MTRVERMKTDSLFFFAEYICGNLFKYVLCSIIIACFRIRLKKICENPFNLPVGRQVCVIRVLYYSDFNASALIRA